MALTTEAREVVLAPVRCRCGKCEEAVADILRLELMLCHGGKNILSRRRTALRKLGRRKYDEGRKR